MVEGTPATPPLCNRRAMIVVRSAARWWATSGFLPTKARRSSVARQPLCRSRQSWICGAETKEARADSQRLSLSGGSRRLLPFLVRTEDQAAEKLQNEIVEILAKDIF